MIWLRLGAVAASLATTALATAPAELERYNVIWNSPSRNAAGSMPIGNGEVGLNVWVEEDGDLRFYLARTDAWSETSRLLKLGGVRVALTPNPFAKGAPFRQELKLRGGRIEIAAAAVRLKVFVDARAPVIHVVGESPQPLAVTATLEGWRTERKVLTGEELVSSWTMQAGPPEIEVWESADVVKAADDAVTWYHRNEHSCVPLTLRIQSLDPFAHLVPDPILHRTFGGVMTAPGFSHEGGKALKSSAPVTRFALRFATHSAVTASPAAWEKQVAEIAASSAGAAAAEAATAAWWNEFWNRSWVFVEGDKLDSKVPAPADREDGEPTAPSAVTQAFVLQRWMAACGGRGNFPTKFNGSIFTVDPEFTDPKQRFNPDWRRWGDCYWWQNTRFPAWSAVANGDYDLCVPVFRLYRAVLPICQARAQLYYGAEGAYFPETMTSFGTYSNRDYGWDRTGKQPGDVGNKYWRWSWQQGLELVQLMLDVHERTLDAAFLAGELVPMAREVLRYFDTRFPRDANGRIIISPTQAVETYWFDVVNDTPTVAGLQAVLDRLLALPQATVPAADREFWKKMKAAAPPLPVRTAEGRSWVAPAEKFDPKRSNVENPELYAVWPFRLFAVGRPDLETGVETFHRRGATRYMSGWSYDGQCAALLGLTAEAQKQILHKAGNSHRDFRFPAMWGPNFDWLPDQDHGGNILLTIQHMILNTDGEKIHLLPAWPKEWNLHFKLHAPRRTTVEGRVRAGLLVGLKVSPAERRKDVLIAGPFPLQAP